MFSMINPNLSHPYCTEFERFGVPFSDKVLKDSLRRRQLITSHDVKYEYFRTIKWWQIDEASNYAPDLICA